MEKSQIKVGNTTMYAVTVPVNLILDRLEFRNPRFRVERFRLIETDGYYIISIEHYHLEEKVEMTDICFITEEDAWSYLEMYGIDRKDDYEISSDRG